MSDIQRYFAPSESEPWKNHHGNWVRYADHVKALEDMKVRAYNDGRLYEGGLNVETLRQAEQRWGGLSRDNWQDGYEQGQRDALAGAVQRVEALPWDDHGFWSVNVVAETVIAAIKGGLA